MSRYLVGIMILYLSEGEEDNLDTDLGGIVSNIINVCTWIKDRFNVSNKVDRKGEK